MNDLSKSQFPGFRLPTTTPIPDEVFDVLMPHLSGAELKALLYICRRTFGWKKETDNISLQQLVAGITTKKGKKLDNGTGLGKASVARAIKSLEQKGVILRTKRQSKRRGDEPTTYALNILSPVSQNETPLVQKMRHPRVSKSDPQQTVVQQTARQHTVNGEDESVIHALPDLNQPKEKRTYIAQSILGELGDDHSYPFYMLVAGKIPEQVIRNALAEIKADGAKYPARVFAYRMKQYALQRHKRM